jgi:FkbM family methyltransferase
MIPGRVFNLLPYLMPKIIGKLPVHRLFFDTARLWSRYSDEFSFRWRRCTLKTLNVEFSLSNFPTYWLNEFYFKERDKYNFRSENGKVYMTIKNYVFNIPFPFGIYELLEVYRDKCYRQALTQGTVLDVGAFIGDTAIYFASNGAERVIAFESVKMLFDFAVENVTLNRYNGVIDVMNCAVGKSNGEAKIMFNPEHPGASSILIRQEKAVKQAVPMISLSKVIREVGTVDLLKLDCEGMEHLLIPSIQQNETLGQVDKIIMEVHGSNKRLLQILKNEGFETIETPQSSNWKHRRALSLVYASKRS